MSYTANLNIIKKLSSSILLKILRPITIYILETKKLCRQILILQDCTYKNYERVSDILSGRNQNIRY